jgi:hypothetical protein
LAEDCLVASLRTPEACAHAVYCTPVVLPKSVRPTTNIHLATEVSDGERSSSAGKW